MSDILSYRTANPAPRLRGLAVAARFNKLVARLGKLERLIRSERQEPSINQSYATHLKRLRLRTKDALSRLSAILQKRRPKGAETVRWPVVINTR
jgi:hypothetical protein